VIKDVGDTWLVVSSRDGGETGRVDAFTNLDGDPYLTATLDGDSVPLPPSALRTAFHECLAPWQAMPPSSEGNLP
jgi:hypothetical protein